MFTSFTKFNYKALRYLYRNGIKASVMRGADYIKSRKKVKFQEDVFTIEVDMCVPKHLVFEEVEAPLVSVIIPAYNQFDYTMRCLDSIEKYTRDMKYEVILADDNSTDKTKNIQQYVDNLVVIRNQSNLMFLRNCNNAAKVAKGKYLVFLNNDTMVTDKWLDELISVLENDNKVGLVGSKLVYPDGKLQEAGGIIWKDASGWNYGRGLDPSLPEYNYLKEVDYVSGASIAISKSLWEEIGGFDEEFAPAYYEDTDLAFEVRKRNLKVVYQPLSTVIHFEGVSHGKDINVGLKAYQIENAKKFLNKWKDVLDRENFDNTDNIFLARDRSGLKKIVLYVDHYVPFYDRDAGSRNTLSNLEILVALGFSVKFIGDNFYKHEPYTTKLQQMGIEVLYGSYYFQYWKNWLTTNGRNISVVLLSRPNIAPKYIDVIRSKTRAKIIYHPHDLHYLRMLREYEVTKNKELIYKAEEIKKIELSLIKKSDTAITLSTIEKAEILKNVDGKDVVIIPMYNYKDFEDIPNSMDGKQNLLFVGGFNHSPNEDGVLWFINDIYPIVKKSFPSIRLFIVGSNPTDKVRAMVSSDILIESNVSDERLTELYNDCRIAIIPLRYGAGVKGKTLEAMSHNIGVVSTSIGSEGLIDIDTYLPAYNSCIDFAERIILLCNDDNELKMNIEKNKEYLKKYLSHEYALEVFEKLFRVE